MILQDHGLGFSSGRWFIESPTAFGIPYQHSDGKKRYRYSVVCRCQCGNHAVVRVDQLRRGISKSCGCLQKDKAAKIMRETMTEHGQGTREWHWLLIRAHNQKKRCTDPEHPSWGRYGGRGIEFRFDTPADAVAYYRTLPNCSRELEIDREDNDGHYERGNVRFITHRENMNNRRRR